MRITRLQSVKRRRDGRTADREKALSTNSTMDAQAAWMLLGREMFRGCEYMNHHFRSAAGPVRFVWMKHIMFASVNDFPRLAISKGTAVPQKTSLAGFAIGLYGDENILLESHVLTVDQDMTCSLSDVEKRVSVQEMCQRLLNTLCTPSVNPTLMLKVPEG
jgi:hypothetical protein